MQPPSTCALLVCEIGAGPLRIRTFAVLHGGHPCQRRIDRATAIAATSSFASDNVHHTFTTA